MDNVMTLCSSPRVASEWHLHTNCWLAFGSLVYTHSKDVGKCPDKYCKALRDEYKKYIHDEVFHERDPKHMESLVVALKAIGNSGRVEMLPEVLQVIKNWESLNPPIIEAIEALRRMTISGNQLTQVRAALLNYFVNMGFCPEIRMVAFVALMDTSPPPAIISRLVQAIQDEKVPIVKQYVFTTLDKDSKFNCKTSERKKQAQSLLGRLLFHKKSRYQSFVYGLNIGEPDSVFSGLEYDETHTPLSSLPRHIRMKNFFGFLGYVAEHMELKIRQDEVMPLFRDLIGPYGTWLDKNSVMDIMRPKRSAAKDGFPDVYHRMKEKLRPEERRGKPFKLTMSAKLFGSEIVYLLLNNSMDAIKSLEEDGTIKLDKDWLGNQLKAGMNLNMNATDVLVDTMKRLPTTAGLPLTYQLTNGGVFRYNAYLQLTTSPLHNLIPWGRVAEETEGTFRECFSVVNNQMIKAYVSAGDTKMGFKFSTYGAFRCPVPFDEVKFETKGRDGKFIRKVVLDVEMNKQNTSFAKTGSEFHFFTYDKNGYWSKEMSKNRPPRLPGPLPGMGPEIGQRLGQEGDGLGRLIGMFGGRGSPMGGNHPHPPGEPMGGRGGSSSGPNGADRGPAHSRRRQIHNGGIPGTSGSGPRTQGMGPQEGVRDASPVVCREAWNDSLALCMDNSKNTHMWFYPGGRPVENINLEYKNSTDADEPYWEYELEIEVDDAGRKHLDKYDIKITVPRPPSSPPPSGAHPSRPSSHREVISIEAMRTLKPRSILPDGRTPKNPEWTACVKLGMNPKERQLQVHAGMGQKDCSVYSVNMSVGYTEKNADPGIDIAISWNSLPDNLEMMTCPAKQIMKQMGKVPGGGQGWGQPPPGAGQGGGPPPPGAGQGGGPPPPGAGQGWGQPPPGAGQGGGPPPPGAGQGWGQPPPGAGQGWGQPPPGAGQGGGPPPPGAGQGGPPPPGAGQEGPPPPGAGQGGGPPPPGAGQGWGLPPPGSGLHLYCFTSFNLSLVMANGTKLQVFGVPTPETLVFEKEMPFFKPIHNKLKGFVKYETCNAIRATDEITTFDKKQFTYRPTTGCPHVLAKDCSKKELFTVFMNVTAESKKELTVVVKDRKGIGHVFVITPEMTVMHDGSPLQMKPIPGEASTSAHHIPRLCKVTKSAEEVVVTCDAGLTVITNAEALQVKVSPWYFHYMCGMCGNFDWRPTDDSRDPVQRVQDLDHAFAASWLVPGENCKSGCKVVQRPLKEVISGKYCVATNALQCAPGCRATRSTNTTLPFACVDQSSPLVAETDKNFRDENFGAILNAFKDKVKSAKYSTIVHYDCNCDKCPLK